MRNQESLNSHQTLFFDRGWGLGIRLPCVYRIYTPQRLLAWKRRGYWTPTLNGRLLEYPRSRACATATARNSDWSDRVTSKGDRSKNVTENGGGDGGIWNVRCVATAGTSSRFADRIIDRVSRRPRNKERGTHRPRIEERRSWVVRPMLCPKRVPCAVAHQGTLIAESSIEDRGTSIEDRGTSFEDRGTSTEDRGTLFEDRGLSCDRFFVQNGVP